MGFSINPEMVRVDFFKPSGKWYTTEAVKWTGGYEGMIYEQFAVGLRNHLGERLSDMVAICLEPYHKYAHPLMFSPGQWLV